MERKIFLIIILTLMLVAVASAPASSQGSPDIDTQDIESPIMYPWGVGQDQVITGSATISDNVSCHNLTWDASPGDSLNIYADLTVTGDINLSAGNISGSIIIQSNDVCQITTGNAHIGSITLQSPLTTGMWILSDDIECDSLRVISGDLVTFDHSINADYFYIGAAYDSPIPVSVYLGQSDIHAINFCVYYGLTNLTFDADESSITCQQFYGGNQVYGTVHLTGSYSVQLDDTNTIDDLIVDGCTRWQIRGENKVIKKVTLKDNLQKVNAATNTAIDVEIDPDIDADGVVIGEKSPYGQSKVKAKEKEVK